MLYTSVAEMVEAGKEYSPMNSTDVVMPSFVLVTLAVAVRFFEEVKSFAENTINRNIFYKFYVLNPPRYPSQDEIPGLNIWFHPCEYFGYQYSHFWYFLTIIEGNDQYNTQNWRTADVIVVPHCAEYQYWRLKQSGVPHEEALRLVDKHYLLPLFSWYDQHPANAIYNGSNFFTVFSMDLGREDFPQANNLTRNWVAATLTGRATWMRETLHDLLNASVQEGKGGDESSRNIFYARACFLPEKKNACSVEEVYSHKFRLFRPQDIVIGFPVRFTVTAASLVPPSKRNRIFAFIGTPNSCSRRRVLRVFGSMERDVAHVSRTPLLGEEGKEYQKLLWSTKFCLILRGSSHTNSARLYEVIMHGCVPVVISEDFQPPLEGFLNWKMFSLFLPMSSIDHLPALLGSIPDDEADNLHFHLVLSKRNAARVLNWYGPDFWQIFLSEVVNKVRINMARSPIYREGQRLAEKWRLALGRVGTQVGKKTHFVLLQQLPFLDRLGIAFTDGQLLWDFNSSISNATRRHIIVLHDLPEFSVEQWKPKKAKCGTSVSLYHELNNSVQLDALVSFLPSWCCSLSNPPSLERLLSESNANSSVLTEEKPEERCRVPLVALFVLEPAWQLVRLLWSYGYFCFEVLHQIKSRPRFIPISAVFETVSTPGSEKELICVFMGSEIMERLLAWGYSEPLDVTSSQLLSFLEEMKWKRKFKSRTVAHPSSIA